MNFSTKTKKIFKKVHLKTWVAVGIMIILLPVVLVTLFKPGTSKANWFNDAWAFRTSLTFTHNATVSTSSKVKFDIDTATLITNGQLQSDCGDSRFTDINGKELPYYIDSAVGACNTSSTDYYVLIPNIINGNNTVYHYFGSPNASDGTQLGQFSESTTTPSGGAATIGSQEKSIGPVAMWHFDEAVDNRCSGGTNDACDTSGNGTDGAISNGTAWKTSDYCVAGTCLYFDGTDDVVTVNNANSIDLDLSSGGLLSGFTFEMWIKPNSAGEGTGGQIFYKGTNTWLKVTNLSSGILDLSASLDEATDATVTASAAVTKDRWTHVALSYTDDADDEITIWVNGVAVATSTNGVGPIAADANNLLIGGTTTNNFAGFIDEFRIYNYEKTSQQLKGDILRVGANDSLSVGFSSNNDSKALSDGLVGYWKLDESSGNAADSSGNATTLTNTNTTPYVGGKYGNGADLELSSSQYESASDNATLSITGSLTLAAWIRPESVSAGTYNIIAKWDGSNESYRLMQNGDEIRLEIDSAGNYVETTSSNLLASSYYHVIGVYDAQRQTITIYINGAVASSSITGTIPSSIGDDAGKIHIGAEDSSTGATGYYDGIIDEARIYNRAFSAEEAEALFRWSASPILHWKFDENTGTTAYDISTNAINSTAFVGNATYGVGKYGSSIKFDGASDGVYVNSSSTLNVTATENISISVWLYRVGDAAFSDLFGLVQKRNVGNAAIGSYSLDAGVGGSCNSGAAENVCFRISDGTNAYYAQTTSSLTADLTWHHIEAVLDRSSGMSIYFDGVLQPVTTSGTLSSVGSLATSNTEKFCVGVEASGCDNSQKTTNGYIDDVKLYKYPRTAAQVLEDMNAGHPLGGSPVGTQVLYWKFDEMNGTTAHDTTASSINGTLTNMATAPSTTSSGWTTNGKINSGLIFDGSNDQVTIATASDSEVDFNGSEAFSGCAWVYPTTAPGSGEADLVLGKWDATTPTRGYRLYLTNDDSDTTGNFTAEIYDESADQTLSASSATDSVSMNTWYHVCLVFNGGQTGASSDLSIYLNGNLVSTNAVNSSFLGLEDVTADFTVGDYDATDATATDTAFTGTIDEVQMFSSALTNRQVGVVMNANAAESFGSNRNASGQDEMSQDVGSASPVLYWNLNENTATTAKDTSGYGLDGTLTNTPTWTVGKYGAGVNFAGSNQHILKADDSNLDFGAGASFTLETWFKHDTASAQEVIISKFASAGYKLLMESDGDITCGIDDDNTSFPEDSVTSTAATYDDNLWHQVVCVKDGNTSLTLYIDGVSVGTPDTSISATGTLANADPFYYGINEDGTSNDYVGQLDELKVFTSALTQAQVAYEYNRGRPVAWWKFDDNVTGNSQTLRDSSGNGKDGTSHYGSNATGMNCTVAGKFNYACNFDGTDDYVSVASPILPTTDFSYSVWVNSSSSTNVGILDIMNGSGVNELTVEYDGTNQKAILYIHGSSVLTTSASVPRNDWHNVVFTRSGNTIKSYVDGKLNSTTATNNTTLSFSTCSITIGAEGITGCGTSQGSYITGKIDDIRIYNYALSAIQISKIYNNDSSTYFGPTSGTPAP